jgi:capsular exopolysaccharide synthesis family protein
MAMGRQRNVRVVAVVGATLGEGKTATTANLAAALAQAENRVLAVSADLRRPRLHDYFHVVNGAGLSDVLAGAAPIEDVVKRRGPRSFLVTSGSLMSNPAELLESESMAALIRVLREQFDFVVIDTPPVLGLADALAVAPLADAVLFVAHADTSRRSVLTQAAEQLRRLGVSIDGCVLTNVTFGRQGTYGYGGYGYPTDGGAPPTSDDGAGPSARSTTGVAAMRRTATGSAEQPRPSKARHRSGRTGDRSPIGRDGRTEAQ